MTDVVPEGRLRAAISLNAAVFQATRLIGPALASLLIVSAGTGWVFAVNAACYLGPTIGGLLIQDISWRWIFYVNVPIGVVAVIAALRTLPTVKPGNAGPLDFRGLVLMSGGAALLTYGLAEIGATGGFTSVKVVAPILIGLALIALEKS